MFYQLAHDQFGEGLPHVMQYLYFEVCYHRNNYFVIETKTSFVYNTTKFLKHCNCFSIYLFFIIFIIKMFQKDSFGDRIYDDLCEDILQFLSFEDKLRLECVSKQFQRTIYSKMTELYFEYLDSDETNLVNLEKILKKFSGLEVKLIGSHDKIPLEVMFNNTNKLTLFNIAPYDGIEERYERKMIEKFGSVLQSLSLSNFKVDTHPMFIPNIEHLCFARFPPEIADIHFNKMKSLTIIYFGFDYEGDYHLPIMCIRKTRFIGVVMTRGRE